MSKQPFNLFILIIIALGLFGIAMNFQHALRSVLTFALVIGLVYLLYKFFIRPNNPSNERNAYNKAAKHSKKKYAAPKKESAKAGKSKKNATIDLLQRKTSGSTSTKKKKKQTPAHLTVIEGKKGKKKNNASY